MENQKSFKYFQFFKNAGLPIFVGLEGHFLSNDLLTAFLNELNFEEVKAEDFEKQRMTNGFRLLKLKRASFQVSKHIGDLQGSDKFAPEKVTPLKGHQLYRYKGHGLMIYSIRHKEWEMAIQKNFFEPQNLIINRIMFNRFLALALGPLGLCGLWGVSIDEGAVIMKAHQSEGECFFVDLENERLFTLEGIKQMDEDFCFLKLSNYLSGKVKSLTNEELHSFLTMNCCTISFNGLPTPIRQVIQHLSQNFKGLIYPETHFIPRNKQANP